jgi:predicted AAA+ superfamily ATPase
MIHRTITDHVIRLSGKYPVITITGPRQSGKTTLVKSIFPGHHYVTMENQFFRDRAMNDPLSFFTTGKIMMILDEVQKVPQLLSYIQEITDRNQINGQFILTGSQSLLLSEKISQTLAGRTAVLKLLPFGLEELSRMTEFKGKSYEECMFTGFYPRIFDKNIQPGDFFPFYFETYVQRDVRQIQNIRDLNQFANFVRLCAGRIGQLLDYSSLAKDAGISVNTAKGWISLLEATYILFLLHPYYHNFSKRIIKSPKLYFTDTGLASFLLNISDPEQMLTHYLKGSLFENMVIMEMLKHRYNLAQPANLWFYRDNNKNEIDCIYEGKELTFIEIKSARSFNTAKKKDLKFTERIVNDQSVKKVIIYGGDESFSQPGFNVISWKEIFSVFDQ